MESVPNLRIEILKHSIALHFHPMTESANAKMGVIHDRYNKNGANKRRPAHFPPHQA
jgi:hypothetical protein